MPEFMFFNSKVWDQYYKLNLKTHVILSQAVTPYFIKQRSGKIVNISSVSGRLPEPGHMPYGSMKAGDISLTWSLARALAPYNIRVNCVCPGFVYTPLWEMGATARHNMVREAMAKGQELPKGVARDIEKLTPREFWLKYIVIPGTPLGREQTAEDMGRAVVFLVSDDAKNIYRPDLACRWRHDHALKNYMQIIIEKGVIMKACVATGEKRKIECQEIPAPPPHQGGFYLKRNMPVFVAVILNTWMAL